MEQRASLTLPASFPITEYVTTDLTYVISIISLCCR